MVTIKWEILWLATPLSLPSVYLMSPHITKSPRPSSSVFAYCRRSTTGDGNGLRTRLHNLLACSLGPSLNPLTRKRVWWLLSNLLAVLSQRYRFWTSIWILGMPFKCMIDYSINRRTPNLIQLDHRLYWPSYVACCSSETLVLWCLPVLSALSFAYQLQLRHMQSCP